MGGRHALNVTEGTVLHVLLMSSISVLGPFFGLLKYDTVRYVRYYLVAPHKNREEGIQLSLTATTVAFAATTTTVTIVKVEVGAFVGGSTRWRVMS
jgi:hypothetical protein